MQLSLYSNLAGPLSDDLHGFSFLRYSICWPTSLYSNTQCANILHVVHMYLKNSRLMPCNLTQSCAQLFCVVKIKWSDSTHSRSPGKKEYNWYAFPNNAHSLNHIRWVVLAPHPHLYYSNIHLRHKITMLIVWLAHHYLFFQECIQCHDGDEPKVAREFSIHCILVQKMYMYY